MFSFNLVRRVPAMLSARLRKRVVPLTARLVRRPLAAAFSASLQRRQHGHLTARLQRRGFSPGYGVQHTDALTMVRALPPESAAAWVFDPPFPRVEEHRAMGTTTRLKISKSSHNPWFNAQFKYEDLDDLIKEARRTLVPGGHFLMKCDYDLLEQFILRNAAMGGKRSECLHMQKVLLWDKQALGTGYVFRSRCEYWLWAVKGEKRRRVSSENRSLSDVFRYKRLKGKKYSPAQMPLAMAYDLITQVTSPGDLVVDPYCGGGGTIPIVANLTDRNVAASELDPSWAQRAVSRVARAVKDKVRVLEEIVKRSVAHLRGAIPPAVPGLE